MLNLKFEFKLNKLNKSFLIFPIIIVKNYIKNVLVINIKNL
jgi:hypothetical protein